MLPQEVVPPAVAELPQTALFPVFLAAPGARQTPSSIRSAQKTELQSEVDLLESNLDTDIQNVSSLQSNMNGVAGKGIPSASAPTLAGSLVTGIRRLCSWRHHVARGRSI